MRKGRELIGKIVVSYETGETLARVWDLIFDQEDHAFTGVLVGEGSWLQGAWVIPTSEMMALGIDALIVASDKSIIRSRKHKGIQSILNRNLGLRGTRIMTTSGIDLGTLLDLYFDDLTKSIVGYEVSGGVFADIYSGRSFVPAPQTLKIGRNFAFVPPEVADLMAEQVGGLKGSVLFASERLQQGSGLVARRLQDITQIVTQKLQDTANQTNQKIQAVVHQAVVTVMNSVIDPDEQKLFTLGRVVDRDIVLADGSLLVREGQPVTEEILLVAEAEAMIDRLYLAVGGSVSAELSHRIQEAIDAGNQHLHGVMDQAVSAMMSSIVDPAEQRAFMIGKTVDQDILLPNKTLLIAKDEIISAEIIDRSEDHRIFYQLYQAVGGSLSQDLSDRVQEATTSGSQRLQDVVHQSVSTLMESLSDPNERKAFMLGKIVDRDIIAPDQRVILRKGEIVTVAATELAEEHGVIDLMFNAVSGGFVALISQRIQETTSSTSQHLQSIVQRAVTSMTQGTMDPVAQKNFVMGKSVEQDIVTPDGTVLITAGNPVTAEIAMIAEDEAMLDQLYKAVGGSFVAELTHQAKQVIATRIVAQTEGRRVRKEVRANDASIIAAVGQIVTPEIITKTQELGKEELLIEATGLSTQDVIQQSGSSLLAGLSTTSDRILQGTGHLGTAASDIWQTLQHKTTQISQDSQQWLELKRIHRALGRPTTRVILDRNDRVILDIGELITHNAIERSRQAGVLGILLSSAYIDKPQISDQEQRAHVLSLAGLQT